MFLCNLCPLRQGPVMTPWKWDLCNGVPTLTLSVYCTFDSSLPSYSSPGRTLAYKSVARTFSCCALFKTSWRANQSQGVCKGDPKGNQLVSKSVTRVEGHAWCASIALMLLRPTNVARLENCGRLSHQSIVAQRMLYTSSAASAFPT